MTGFSRFWKPWGKVFALGAILPNVFPGLAASAATLLLYLFGLSDTTGGAARVFKRLRITTLLAMVIFCVLITFAYLLELLS